MMPNQENTVEVLYVLVNGKEVLGIFDSIPKAVAGAGDEDTLDSSTIYACVLNRKLVYPLKYASDQR